MGQHEPQRPDEMGGLSPIALRVRSVLDPWGWAKSNSQPCHQYGTRQGAGQQVKYWLPDAAPARSPASIRTTDKPRPAASQAIPAPLMPPPIIARSYGCRPAMVPGFPFALIRHPGPGPLKQRQIPALTGLSFKFLYCASDDAHPPTYASPSPPMGEGYQPFDEVVTRGKRVV